MKRLTLILVVCLLIHPTISRAQVMTCNTITSLFTIHHTWDHHGFAAGSNAYGSHKDAQPSKCTISQDLNVRAYTKIATHSYPDQQTTKLIRMTTAEVFTLDGRVVYVLHPSSIKIRVYPSQSIDNSIPFMQLSGIAQGIEHHDGYRPLDTCVLLSHDDTQLTTVLKSVVLPLQLRRWQTTDSTSRILTNSRPLLRVTQRGC